MVIISAPEPQNRESQFKESAKSANPRSCWRKERTDVHNPSGEVQLLGLLCAL